jgi:catechol 2,3-dioxygenase-like lactoylglutathione lyase family enzyme
MNLEFLFVPTTDMAASLTLYRDGLGFVEQWREGEATVALSLPGSTVSLMLDANDPSAPAGPIFVVDDLAQFHAARPATLGVIEEPAEIPGGVMATYQDPGGAVLYFLDQSTDSAPE